MYGEEITQVFFYTGALATVKGWFKANKTIDYWLDDVSPM